MDLNVNFEKNIPRKSYIYTRSIDMSLKYVMDSGAIHENIDKIKVITRRSTFSYIMQSFYNKKYDEVSVCVSRYDGNLYMVIDEKDELKPVNMHHRRLQQLLLIFHM